MKFFFCLFLFYYYQELFRRLGLLTWFFFFTFLKKTQDRLFEWKDNGTIRVERRFRATSLHHDDDVGIVLFFFPFYARQSKWVTVLFFFWLMTCHRSFLNWRLSILRTTIRSNVKRSHSSSHLICTSLSFFFFCGRHRRQDKFTHLAKIHRELPVAARERAAF